jgi:hypothetical protein
MMDMRKKSLAERLGWEFYTLEEVAEYLRMAPGTLRNKRAKGRGPRAVKIEGRVLFDSRDVKEYIEKGVAA